MNLNLGDKFGDRYQLLSKLGEGGMGEVWKARDTRLDRDVALKVSKAEFTARFDREARALANFSHNSICQIYDVGPNYIVMELIDGVQLSGPLPVEKAVAYAEQILDALGAAHQKKFTHRDLKPANVMVMKSGNLKLLDFGLAKQQQVELAPDDETRTAPKGLSNEQGIVGTLQYMSPEQLQGKEADPRSDIFGFGCVLYELLSGKKAFSGSSAASVIAAIMEREPEPLQTTPPLDRVIRKCLAKDSDERFQNARDLKAALLWATEDATAAPSQSRFSKTGWVAVAVLALVAAATSWSAYRAARPAELKPLIRLNVDLGKDAERDGRVSAILSPDATRIVYTAKAPGGFRQLYTRRLDQARATLLSPEIVLRTNPFFSPNGEWVAYWKNDKLMKAPAPGGEPIAIGATPTNFNGASWGDDDNIIVASDTGLWRLPARGGAAELVQGTAGTRALAWPQVLPGAQAVLITSATTGGITWDSADIDIVQLATGEKKNLVHGGYWPRYLPTSGQTGHLVYLRKGTLYGVGFDPRSLALLGKPTPLLDDVASDSVAIAVGGQFAFSNNGTLVYLSGKPQDATYPISWLDASGKVTIVVAQPGAYGSPRISPDGKLLAYIAAGNSGADKTGYDLWVYDLARGTPTQITFAGEVVNEIAWAWDSRHLAWQDGKSLWWTRSDGAGQKQLLLDGKVLGPMPLGPRAFSFSPGLVAAQRKDARLAFAPLPGALPDVWTLPIDLTDPEHPKPGKPEPFLTDPALVEVDPSFSPDGKFLAYSESHGDATDIFVRPFPGPGGKWKVSTRGGQFPAWSPATHELFFVGGDDRIMVANYSIQGDSFSPGVPRVWSPTPVRRNGVQLNFDISPDGKRVIMFPQPVAETSTENLHATFLLNFFDGVRRRVPVGK